MILHRCPLTDQELLHACPTQTCMWYSRHADTGCMATPHVPDGEEITEEQVALHRNISVKEVRLTRKRGERRIEQVLSIYRYLEWVSNTLQPAEYPWVAGYLDPKLQTWISAWVTERWPYTVTELEWNMGRIAACMNKTLWRRYADSMGVKVDSEKLMGLKPEEARAVITQFRAACARHTKEQ